MRCARLTTSVLPRVTIHPVRGRGLQTLGRVVGHDGGVTIALVIKVNDGVVLAADSATTMGSVGGPDGSLQVMNIYNNANKVFNLHKGGCRSGQ